MGFSRVAGLRVSPPGDGLKSGDFGYETRGAHRGDAHILSGFPVFSA
jgi:hypothetical protein